MTTSRARSSVYLADDHPMCLGALTRAVKLRPDLEFVGSAGDGRQALDDLRRLRPDVAVLDLRMPSLDGREVTRALARDAPEIRVLMLSAHMESSLVYEMLASGAKGFLSKLTNEREVCDAIAALVRGEAVLPRDLQPGLLSELQDRARVSGPRLTEREQEVLVLVAGGMSAPEIAERLVLSAATVRSHLKNIYEKLGVSSQAAAVAAAMRQGLLE